MKNSELDEIQNLKNKFLDLVEQPDLLAQLFFVEKLGYGPPLLIQPMAGFILACIKERNDHREALKSIDSTDL